MVLDDVPQRARLLVVGGPVLDPQLLGDRDLDRVDVMGAPDRLEDGVREPEGQDVLDRLLAQVVVDPEDGVLAERALEDEVELGGRLEVRAERLLNHDPAPALVVLPRHSRGSQALGDGGVGGRRRRAVVEGVAARAPLVIECVQALLESLEALRLGEVDGHVVDARQKALQHAVVDRLGARVLPHGGRRAFAELVRGEVVDGGADQTEPGRQQSLLGQVVERRQQLAVGEVPGRAEYHHHGGRGRAVLVQPFGERVGRGRRLRHLRSGAVSAVWTWWPPNWLRIMASIRSAKVSSIRLRKRS